MLTSIINTIKPFEIPTGKYHPSVVGIFKVATLMDSVVLTVLPIAFDFGRFLAIEATSIRNLDGYFQLVVLNQQFAVHIPNEFNSVVIVYCFKNTLFFGDFLFEKKLPEFLITI